MMRHSPSVFICLALALSSGACAPPAFGKQSEASGTPAPQPRDVRLAVETGNGKSQFQIGEIIPLKLTFTSSAPKKYQISMASYDRSGRMAYEKFMVEPE